LPCSYSGKPVQILQILNKTWHGYLVHVNSSLQEVLHKNNIKLTIPLQGICKKLNLYSAYHLQLDIAGAVTRMKQKEGNKFVILLE